MVVGGAGGDDDEDIRGAGRQMKKASYTVKYFETNHRDQPCSSPLSLACNAMQVNG